MLEDKLEENPQTKHDPWASPWQRDDLTFDEKRVAAHDRAERCEALWDEITRTAGQMNALTYTFIKKLDDFDRADGWCGDGIRSFAHWLNWQCGIGEVEAREKVRVARALRTLPRIDEAFRIGEMSYSKVRAMTRIATPDNEEYLLYLARHGTTGHVELVVRSYRRCRQLMEDDPHAALDRHFSWYQDEDGSYVIGGRLPADEGEVVVTALRNIMDLLWKEQQQSATQDAGEGDVSTETRYEVHSSAETENPSSIHDQGAGDDSAAQFSHSMASAVVRMAEHTLATGIENDALNLKTPTGAERNQLVVFVNVNDAHRDCGIEGGPALNTASGQFMHPDVVRRIACDASIRPISEDDEGNILNIGRASRKLTTALRVALYRRDGGCCRYPGCTQRRWTDAHHIEHWLNGGETCLENLITLCRFHHTQLHLGKYQIKRLAGDFVFLTREGRRMARVVAQDPHDPEAVRREVEARLTADGIEITPATAVTAWHGERMDLSMALDGLFASEPDGERA